VPQKLQDGVCDLVVPDIARLDAVEEHLGGLQVLRAEGRKWRIRHAAQQEAEGASFGPVPLQRLGRLIEDGTRRRVGHCPFLDSLLE
jgi:hypothetical protein